MEAKNSTQKGACCGQELWRKEEKRKDEKHDMSPHWSCGVIQDSGRLRSKRFDRKQQHEVHVVSQIIRCILPDRSRVHVSSHEFDKIQ